MRVLFALPGLHRIDRGAEVAFISVANELVGLGADVTLIGSGQSRQGTKYRFLHAGSIGRETFAKFPSMPLFRDDCAYEELTFIPQFMSRYRPVDYDVTLTCSYPFTNWMLRRPDWRGTAPPARFRNGKRRLAGLCKPVRVPIIRLRRIGMHKSGLLRAQSRTLAHRTYSQRRGLQPLLTGTG